MAFTGAFDGNSHAISNLTIVGESYLGLFGRVCGSGISNLRLEAVDVNGTGSNVGGLVGVNFSYPKYLMSAPLFKFFRQRGGHVSIIHYSSA